MFWVHGGTVSFMDIYAIHAASLKDLQNEAGATCPAMFYNNALISILPGGATYKSSNSQGGLSINADLSLTVLTAAFPTGFDFDAMTNQQFNYPGQNGPLYSVDSVIKSPNGFQVRILANSAAEGL